MNIKIEISVRRVAKGKLKKARFYADFRVSQSPSKINNGRLIANESGKNTISSNQ